MAKWTAAFSYVVELSPVFLWLSCILACSAAASPPRPRFVDVAEIVGLTQVHTSGSPDKGYIVEAKGGGSAFLDYDGDGDLDIYWINGASLEAPEQSAGNILYRNDGDKGFKDVTEAAGVRGRGWSMGAISADYDNDGDQDLYITNLQENILYRNDGARGFVDVAEQAGVATPRWNTGAAFADYDLDGDLDLYVASYLKFDHGEIPRLGATWKGVDVFVGPLSLLGEQDVFYRNNGDGTFAEITARARLTHPSPRYGLGVLFTDCDGDGYPDIYVANDVTPNFLYHNRGDGRFNEISLPANVAYGGEGKRQASMGLAWGDYDANGHPDIFVTHFESDYNTLYRNDGDGRFADVSSAAGLLETSLPYVSFGTGFLDYDNDGDLDLLVANGHVYPQIDQAGTASTYAQPNHLFENLGDGRFALLLPQPGDSLGRARASRGSCIGDYDNDGDLDIFVTQVDDRPSLLRNDVGNRQNWIGLKLTGRTGNRDGIGARVRAVAGGRVQIRDVICGSSFLCSEDRRLHFGLGSNLRVDSLEVRWPGGAVQRFAGLPVNRYLLIEEGMPETKVLYQED